MGALALIEAGPDDRDRLSRMMSEMWAAHGAEAEPAELDAKIDLLLGAGHLAFLIERDGVDVGYALVRENGDHVFLRQFLIGTEARSAGLGRAAFALLRARWPDLEFRLDVLNGAVRARRFWERRGFEAVAVNMRLAAGEPA